MSSSSLNHYIAQRVTAIILIPTAVWFIVFIFKLSNASSLQELGSYLLSPFNVIVAILFLLVLLYHGLLGMKEIIADYVHCTITKKIIDNTLFIVTVISAIAAVFSVVYFFIVLKIFFPC